ncbi:MAG: S9 family peptidase [Erythrobacter sp.]
MPAPPLTAYGDLPAVAEADISPGGNYIALLMSAGGERFITVLDAKGEPVQRFVVGDAKVRGIEWVGEEAILLLRSETGRLPRHFIDAKTEFARGNVIPLDNSRSPVSIFADQRHIANAIVGFYGVRQVDGRWLGYFGGLRRGSTSGDRNRLLDYAAALFAVDLMTGDTQIVAYPDDYPSVRYWLVHDAGEVGAQLQLDHVNGNWRIENGEGKTIARGQQERGDISLIGFDEAGTGVIYGFHDAREVWEDEAIRNYIRQPYSARVLGIQGRDGHIVMSDPAQQHVLNDTLNAFSHTSHAEIADFDTGFDTLVAHTSGNYDSGTWYRVDGNSGERAIIGMARPAIQGPTIGKVSTVTWQAQDGMEIRGILTLPPSREATDLPAIVLPHGGPTAHDIEAFDWWAQAFASRGYAVLQPNFRGSTGRGADFVRAGDGEWGRKMQTDKSDGLMALAERGIVDPERACIVGASYGGYAALAGVTLQQGIYRCAVSVNGVADLSSLTRLERTGGRDIISRSFDRQFGDDPDLDAISPSENAAKANAPILLIHGRDDTVVPFEQSARMLDALRDAGKPVEFVELEGEDHWLSNAATRRAMLKAAVDFVARHNPPN